MSLQRTILRSTRSKMPSIPSSGLRRGRRWGSGLGQRELFRTTPYSSMGSHKVTVVPWPMTLVISIPPPCCSMICVTIGNPKPTPKLLVLYSGSKIRSRSSGAVPGPVSVTQISTRVCRRRVAISVVQSWLRLRNLVRSLARGASRIVFHREP